MTTKKEYYKNLAQYIKQHDLQGAGRVVLKELSDILVSRRDDFIFMLKNAGLPADASSTDAELIDTFLSNIHNNKRLMLGASFLISDNNKRQSGFDGEFEHDEDGMKATHRVLYNYFDANLFDDFDDDSSEFGGGGAIMGAIGEVSKLGSGVIEGQRAKTSGATDLFKKKQESRDAMVQSILAQRQAQQIANQTKAEQSSKTTKYVIIGTVSILAIGLIATTVYLIKKNK